MSRHPSFSNLPSYLGEIQARKLKSKSSQGFDMAGIEMDRKNIFDLNLLIGIDVSGSISASMFKDFMTQLNEVKGMSRIKVIEVGDKIEAIYDFTTPKNKVVRLGGGGGNGEHLFFPLAKKFAPDAIIYMTDGFCTHATDPKIPTAWILTQNGKQPYDWGTVVGRLPH